MDYSLIYYILEVQKLNNFVDVLLAILLAGFVVWYFRISNGFQHHLTNQNLFEEYI